MTARAAMPEFDPPDLRTAHVIVVANEKGGTGKSTLSIHISVALLKAGFRVATIDLDTRQQTLTRFFENRASWAASAPWAVELPRHHALDRGNSDNVRDNETWEFGAFATAIAEVEHEYEFVVIDTPASDSYLMRLAHSLADTLVSPVNDSFIDVDVFSRVHHDRTKRGQVAQYADLVLEARRKRKMVDQGIIDWIIVRNRMSSTQSNNAKQIAGSLSRLASQLKFRPADGLHDRVIFRELFPIGLTALDPIEEAMRGSSLSASQISARREVESLIETLKLPERSRGMAHLQARHDWFERISRYYRDLQD
ncbi:division plane positioning ATPase MipZ [uncultured Methylovirgula sp.]|uniref:division plane positioning ATPase MipZ n=1 Tax=uncultured Methylovirgula sp. TaxID=1285960 RepID=UPI002636AE22|nr:division plane positioning ATPase MipZ [uncultured Methylovirgula sp.]